MPHPDPAISVLIPAYRVTAYIAETVESALQQTRQDHEVLVINDGCPDTANLERALEPYQSRIRYIVQENGGPGAARNRGLAEARGRYVALLDGDDRWEPEYVRDQLGRAEADPAIDLLYPNGRIFGGTPLDGTLGRAPSEADGEVTLDALIEGTKVVTNIAMMKREIVQRAGGWDPAVRHAEDFDLWMRIAALGARMVYNPTVLAGYRIRPGSQTEDTVSMYAGQIYACEKALRTQTALTARQRELLEHRVAWATAHRHVVEGKTALAAGDAAGAREHFEQAFPLAGNRKLQWILTGLRLFPSATVAAVRRLERARKGTGR
jgi:glycosyltransferase involved in cell wall biosynthesis